MIRGWAQAIMPINVSTGIDNNSQSLPDSAIDPNWKLVSAMSGDTNTRVVPYYQGAWQPAPVPGSNAKWINRNGTIAGVPAGDYVYERAVSVTAGTLVLRGDFNIAFDDSLAHLELIDPNQVVYALPWTPIDTYQLSYPIACTFNNPVAGTWKLRVHTYHWDQIGGLLVSGNIFLHTTPLPVSCCDSTVVTNGSFSSGNLAGNGSFTGCNAQFPASYETSWCGIGTPQVAYAGGNHGYYMSFWGVGQNFNSGEGIYQQVNIVQGQRYKICFDAYATHYGAVWPAQFYLRFAGDTQQPTSIHSGALIQDYALAIFDWHQGTFYWTAPASYNYLILSVRNSIPTNDSTLATWVSLDNLCIEPVAALAQNCCDTALIHNGDFSLGRKGTESDLMCNDGPPYSYFNDWCKIKSPQYVLRDLNDPCVGLWGVGNNFAAGEGIYQAVSFVENKTYEFCLDARWVDIKRMGPSEITLRFCASNTAPTTNDCYVAIGQVTAVSANWNHFTFTWTANADYSYLLIAAHNSSTIDDAEYVSYGLIDNICAHEVSSSVGAPDPTWEALSIYPNPTSSILHIIGLPAHVKVRFAVVDAWGRTLLQSSTPDIDVQALAAGMYFVRVESAQGTKVVRFVKN